MATSTRPKIKHTPVRLRTAQEQRNYAELLYYLEQEGISWNAWVMRRVASALPFFRTKYGHQRAQEEQG